MNILQQIQQESIKRELANRLNFEKAEQNSLISQVQDDVLKGMSEEEILEKNRNGGYDLTKGKSMPIGTIPNGYKKIADGKWRKVSESHKMTKEEHEKEADIDEETDKNIIMVLSLVQIKELALN